MSEMAVADAGDPKYAEAFYSTEWDDVVQARDVSTRDDYLTATRWSRHPAQPKATGENLGGVRLLSRTPQR